MESKEIEITETEPRQAITIAPKKKRDLGWMFGKLMQVIDGEESLSGLATKTIGRKNIENYKSKAKEALSEYEDDDNDPELLEEGSDYE